MQENENKKKRNKKQTNILIHRFMSEKVHVIHSCSHRNINANNFEIFGWTSNRCHLDNKKIKCNNERHDILGFNNSDQSL